MNPTASSIIADGYIQMLDRLEIKERIKCLEELLRCPLEEGVRPVLRREYLNLTEKART